MADNYRALDDVAQLAYVAGPGMGSQRLEQLGIRPAHGFFIGACELLYEMLREHGDVFLARAQRWQVDRENVKRNRPSRKARCKGRLEAASTRTSMGISTVPPSRRSLRSSSTRNSRACRSSFISVISSSSRVPPSASSK